MFLLLVLGFLVSIWYRIRDSGLKCLCSIRHYRHPSISKARIEGQVLRRGFGFWRHMALERESVVIRR